MSKNDQCNSKNLIWIDLEMTGLDTLLDSILEIATIVTDKDLNILAEGPVLAIYQSETILAKMDAWNQEHHSRSGLIERVRNSSYTAQEAERLTLEFLKGYVPQGVSPMCGNGICQDRRFLFRFMPELEQYFRYRNLDVSVLKELAYRWKPDVVKGFKKKATHVALDDTRESIEELRYYRAHFIRE